MPGPVRLSDAYIHDVYASYSSLPIVETAPMTAAGVLAHSEYFDQVAALGGKLTTMPFWQDIDPSIEENYSNDDPADEAVPNKIGSASMTARKAWVNQGFSEMNLVQELAGSSPMEFIKSRFNTYWQRRLERRMIAICIGLFNANVAQNSSDMVVDISGGTGDAAKFNSGAFIDAAFTSGDAADDFTAVAVHSSIMANMVKTGEAQEHLNEKGELVYRTYKGRVIVTSDLMPILSGTGVNAIYLTILFGRGAFGFGGGDGSLFAFGEGIPKKASEIASSPRIGNGAGGEELWERKTWLLHPGGFSWDEGGATLTEFSPTIADLKLAAHWHRVVPRKLAKLAFIKSKA